MRSILTDPVAIAALLCLNVAVIEWLVRRTFLSHFGTALLVILLTAVEANLGLIPANAEQAPIYGGIFTYLAPLAIFFPLLQVNLRSVLKAGAPMIGAFLIGTLGTVAGVWIAMMVVDGPQSLGEDYRAIGGMFTGTYIGGGVNFNALALHYGMASKGAVFAGANAVDNIFTALWMMATIALPRILARYFPRAVSQPQPQTPAVEAAIPSPENADAERVSPADLALLLALGGLSVWASERLSEVLAAWAISIPSVLILTSLALALAQSPIVNRLKGSRILGMLAVYLFLAVIGAFCDLSALYHIGSLGLTLLAFVAVLITVHGLLIFGVGIALGIDWDVLAIASQANVGGATSALALVRSLGRFDLVLPSVLVGSLGYGLGTYLGFLMAERLL